MLRLVPKRIILLAASFTVFTISSTTVFSQEGTPSVDDLLKSAESENAKLTKLSQLRKENERLRTELGLTPKPRGEETFASSRVSSGTEPSSPEGTTLIAEKNVGIQQVEFATAAPPLKETSQGQKSEAALSPSSWGQDATGEKALKTKPSGSEPTQLAQTEEESFNERVQIYFGTEIVGASAAASEAQPFFNIRLNVPIRNRAKCDLLSNPSTASNLRCFKFWADFRLASSPSQSLPNFNNLEGTAAGGFFGSNQSSSINELVKSFQTKIGLEYGMGRGFSFIGGAGITSPLSSTQSVQVYKIPRLESGEVLPSFKTIFGDIDYANLENLILTSGERDRFQRNWFVGGRLRHRFWERAYPAEFDLTIGQDEVITRKLIGGILKFDANVPIKVADRDFLYFGAGFGLKLTRRVNVVTLPFFLEPVADFSLFSNNNLIRNVDDTPFGNSNRDTYSFRVGVDLLRLFNK